MFSPLKCQNNDIHNEIFLDIATDTIKNDDTFDYNRKSCILAVAVKAVTAFPPQKWMITADDIIAAFSPIGRMTPVVAAFPLQKRMVMADDIIAAFSLMGRMTPAVAAFPLQKWIITADNIIPAFSPMGE